MVEIENASPEYLFEAVNDLCEQNYRLVQIHCTQVKDGDAFAREITYSFDKDLTMRHLRIVVPEGFVADSISKLYSFAFLYENEIKDLFGVEFRGLSLDFKGNLYITNQKTPMVTKLEDEDSGK